MGRVGRHKEALDCFIRAIRLRPKDANCLNDCGVAYEQLQQLNEAVESYKMAVALSPLHAQAHINLSNVLRKIHCIGEAIAAAQQAISICGQTPEALNSLGAAYLEQADAEQACQCFIRAVELRPGFAAAHMNLAYAMLMKGDYQQAWTHYTWLRQGAYSSFTPHHGADWVAQDLSRKSVLIRSDGGLGNVMQFARFLPMVVDLGAQVILQCPQPLVSLMQSVKGISSVIARGSMLPAVDIDLPQRCLPQVLGITLENLPAQVPYLHPDPRQVSHWHQVLNRQASGVRVGVCWQGSQKLVHRRDSSFSSLDLLPLMQMPGINLINLQVDAEPDPVLPLITLEGYRQASADLMTTAAIICNLDLIVTCDTSIAHLAGALGVRTWVALRFASEWRWMLNRQDSPWYPTIRLFRQSTPREWKPVFCAMAQELAALSGSC